MATLGYTTAPGPTNFIFDASHNQAASFVGTMPSPGGYVTQIQVYFASQSGTGNAYMCLWDGSGNLLYQSSVFTSSNTQNWRVLSVANFYVAAGQSLFIGVTDASGVGLSMQYGSNASYKWDWGQNATVPGNLAGFTVFNSQAIGAYITYTPLTAPTISSVTPNPVAPGQQITVTGTGFLHASGVTVGGVACTSLSITSDTSLTCFLAGSTPGGTQGVVVTNPAGSNTAFNITVGGIAHINTGTPAAPVWTQGTVYINTGTPASPVWTVAAPVQVWNGSSWVIAS